MTLIIINHIVRSVIRQFLAKLPKKFSVRPSVPARLDLARRAVGLDDAVAPQVEEDERVQRRDGCGGGGNSIESK